MLIKLEELFKEFSIGSQKQLGLNARVILRYVSGKKNIWLITEGEQMQNGDFLMYGCYIQGNSYEWSFVMLSEMVVFTSVIKHAACIVCDEGSVGDYLSKRRFCSGGNARRAS